MSDTELNHLATPGTRIEVRVTPKAAKNHIFLRDGQVHIQVTAAPESGKANVAVLKLLAKAVGIPKSRLTLVRGQTTRTKIFEVL